MNWTSQYADNTVNTTFNRDSLYSHSFAGESTVCMLSTKPHLFNVYLSALPYLIWNDEYIFGPNIPLKTEPQPNGMTKPARQLSFGGYEEHSQKRRTETLEAYGTRRAFLRSLKTETLILELYNELQSRARLRHIKLHEYPFSYHVAVGGNALADEIDCFLDW
ncbi:hypothetical protein P154DRAFT_501549 [Amniculicola lignicola CBS 123094]|uniref:Uncharacterized protein n=1 Tax=Amniculicola lignicola CBS 123094 TaxID=1392246 RepID=A0A6A5W067_9PLEO|nr:hypothetical protein P154DRAFT_501549 [Amniculicola lignicola CBS 123094]